MAVPTCFLAFFWKINKFIFTPTLLKTMCNQSSYVNYIIMCLFIKHFIVVLLQLSQFSPFALLCPAQSRSHSKFPHCCPCRWVIHKHSLTSPFPFSPPLAPSFLPSGHYQSVPCFPAPSFILLICLFCSLGSSYRWDHMVCVFHCLAYFT